MNRFGLGLVAAVRNPVETASWMISFALLFFAAYYSSPWYQPEYVTPLTLSFSGQYEKYLVSAIFAAGALPGVLAPFFPEKRKNLVKSGALYASLLWGYLFFLRIFSIGWVPIAWLPLLLASLVAGLFRLYFWIIDK